MVKEIAKKNMWERAKFEFVVIIGSKYRKTKATYNTRESIVYVMAEKFRVGGDKKSRGR